MLQKYVSFYVQEHMKPYCSNEVFQVLLYVKKISKLFARATLYDRNMQEDGPTILAISAFLFGLHAATTTTSDKFIPKDTLVVREAWRNVAREMLSSYTEEEMEQLMHEKTHALAQIFA